MVTLMTFREIKSVVTRSIVRILVSPIVVLLFVAGVLCCMLYGVCASIGTLLAGLGSFAALLALLDGSYAEALASAFVALLLCPFVAPRLLHWAGSSLILAATMLFNYFY